MSQVIFLGSSGGGGSKGVLTVPTDNGTATPDSSGVLNLITGQATNDSGSTIAFYGSGNTVELLLNDARSNMILGSGSGKLILVGSSNNVLGHNSFTSCISSSFNCVLGSISLRNITTGGSNIVIGFGSGNQLLTSESSNIIIGAATSSATGISNALVIGSGTGTAQGNLSTATICGINGATSASGVAVLINSSNVLGTTTSSREFKTNIQDMANQSREIYNLRPVTFNYKPDGTHVSQEDSLLKQYGLIAEEVEEIIPELAKYNKEGKVESVRYLNLIPMLLNELQKLRKEFDEYKRINT
jgi:hypothetical protein